MTEVSSRRAGRGRLSSIEMLPEHCDDDIAWANTELRERKMPQNEILRQFNARLADKGIKGVSKGSFSRWSVRTAIELRKQTASREITKAVLDRLPVGDRDEMTRAAIELVKYRIVELVTDEGVPDPKLLGQASLALQRLTNTTTALDDAKRKALDHSKKAEKEEAAEKAAADAEREEAERQETAATVEQIANEAGLSADRVAAIRRGVLGLAA